MDPRNAPTVPDAGDGDFEAPPSLGRFAIGRSLGAGGMGVVFEARDTVLDRAVALKLVRPGTSPDPAQGLLREAVALAQLVHPNVVTVFDVGPIGDDVFIAMELVDGDTLRAWMTGAHPWRAIVDMFMAAGRGLAAVHALGRVHRDFKPSNVLIDRAGTPKVGDFGLVCVDGEDAHGVVMGTPGYMAPEQARGGRIDARADQYAFAVALLEALGDAGPARLRPILARARADDPAARFPSMNALLAALARARRGPLRWWLAGLGTAAGLAIIAVAWQVGHVQAAVDPCPAPEAELGPVWGDARRAEIRQHVGAIDPAQGAARFDVVARAFDGFTTSWRDQWVGACRATRVAGGQSDTLLDRRVACLDRALAQLGETVDAVGRTASPVGLDAAMHAVVALPALDACADTAELTEKLPPPLEPARRAEFDAITREIAAIVVRRDIDGKLAGLEDRARAVVARARALGHPPSLADALMSLAEVQVSHQEADALATLDEVVQVAAAAHDDRLVASAWLREINFLGDTLERVDDAEKLVATARAAVARADNRRSLRLGLLLQEARIANLRSDFPRARGLVAQSLVGLEGVSNADRTERAKAQLTAADIEGGAGAWTKAAGLYRDYIMTTTALLGPDHPDVLHAYFNLGVCLRHAGDDAGALVAFREAARIGLARLAPSPKLADLIGAVGSTLLALGRPAEALPFLEQDVAMARATMKPDDPRLAEPIDLLAATLMNLRRFDAARPMYTEALARFAKVNTPSVAWANTFQHLAELEAAADHCDRSLVLARQAIAMNTLVSHADKSDVAASNYIAGAEDLIAECSVKQGHWPAALQASARARALASAGSGELAVAQYYEGRALVESGRGVAAGLREVRAARTALAATTGAELTVAEMDHWLAARR
jgi:tetratricopeptide (TPR) repeat protein